MIGDMFIWTFATRKRNSEQFSCFVHLTETIGIQLFTNHKSGNIGEDFYPRKYPHIWEKI